MTAIVSDYKNFLYLRDYANDLSSQTDLLKRIALASLPFFSLHTSFRLPISLGMGSVRAWNAEDYLQKGIAVVALAGMIFQHRVGCIVTIIQDIIIEANLLRSQDNLGGASKSLVKILQNLVYLLLICRGGIELSILSLLLQGVVNLVSSREEFKNDRWIEGFANLLMAGIRLRQTHTQYQQLKRNWEIEAAIKRFYIGELHEKWEFPSDHLPVGIEVHGVRIISWNVLNNAYIKWVTEKDSQGLNGSMISQLNQPISDNGLTLRDVRIVDMIQTMTEKGQVIALQECSVPFLQILQQRLPSNWQIVKSFENDQTNQDVILYNKDHLTLASSQTSTTAYPSAPYQPLQDTLFTNHLHIINAHIPGDPTKPGRDELAQYVHDHHQKGTITIALGDHNFERNEMIDSYKKAGYTDFSFHSPWQTNIDPDTKESKGIDHFFVIGDKNSRDLSVNEILTNGNLQETIDLLKRYQSST